MNLKPFTGPGSTPSRRRFWDKVTQAVIASQKVAGRFVTVDEHPGKGTVINVADNRRPTPTPPPPTGCPTSITFDGIEFCCSCVLPEGSNPIQFHEDIIDDFEYHINGTFPLSGGTGIDCDFCFNDADSVLLAQISDDTDCPTGSETSFPVPIIIYVTQVSDIFYVLVLSGFFDEIFFSGSNAGTTISNNISACSFPDPDTFDDPLIECLFSRPISECVAGKNGTVTLNF